MIKSMFYILFLNGCTGITISLLYRHTLYTYMNTLLTLHSIQDEKINELLQKIYKLENTITELQENKQLDNQIKADLQNKLEDFTQYIVTQYEVIE